MSSDALTLVKVDKRFPASMAGDSEKVVRVKTDESGYEHSPPASRLVGEIILWPLNTAPTGYLSCRTDDSDTTEYETADYPALGALLEPVLPGPSGAGYFQTPAINFPKNSGGVDTLDMEAASVGTHGHTASTTGAHQHSVSISSSGNHQHGANVRYGSVQQPVFGSSSPGSWDAGTAYTNSAGAHTHSADMGDGGSHTHSIANHVGVNQPSCTLIHYCIKH